MTTVKQLYSLQEVDLDLDQVNKLIADVEKELETRLFLDKLEEDLDGAREELQGVQEAHREMQGEMDRQRERLARMDEQLYSGEISNSRDLEAMQLEANNLRHQLERHDVRLLELSLRAEDYRAAIADLDRRLKETRDAWEVRQSELWDKLEELTVRQESLTKDRDKLASQVNNTELLHYENLRRSKGGQAVARVAGGLCQACRMSLPSQHLQRVRAGRQTVYCNSCGRMLLSS